MTKLYITEDRCQIKDEPDVDLLWALDQELSYKIQGAEYTKSFKMNVWDGRKKLLTNRLTFPNGLRQRVEEFYGKYNKTIEVVDMRRATPAADSIDIISSLKSHGITPYPYQLETINKVSGFDCGIIRMATGSGKTLISALITADIGKSTIIYVIGKDLLHQLHKMFSDIFPNKIGKIGDGICEIEDINIASVWTMGQALDVKKGDRDSEKIVASNKYGSIRQLLKSAKVHIYDECHVASCDTIQAIGKYIRPEHVYGMSASPWRDDNSDLLIEASLGKKIVDISASYLIERNYLVKPIVKFKKVPRYHEKLPKNYNTIYKSYIVENDVRNNMVLENTENLVSLGYKTLVLYQTIAHGKILYDLISEKIPCILLSGKDSSKIRDEAKEKIESGEIKCIIASKIFDIGVDLPCLSGLVVAGSGKSSVRALQRIGRVIRKYPNKKQAAVVDFVDSATYLSKHSKARRDIYSIEEKFDVSWPK